MYQWGVLSKIVIVYIHMFQSGLRLPFIYIFAGRFVFVSSLTSAISVRNTLSLAIADIRKNARMWIAAKLLIKEELVVIQENTIILSIVSSSDTEKVENPKIHSNLIKERKF